MDLLDYNAFYNDADFYRAVAVALISEYGGGILTTKRQRRGPAAKPGKTTNKETRYAMRRHEKRKRKTGITPLGDW